MCWCCVLFLSKAERERETKRETEVQVLGLGLGGMFSEKREREVQVLNMQKDVSRKAGEYCCVSERGIINVFIQMT